MARRRLNDFNHRILTEAGHRPWPMPDTPWVMRQTWHDLLFAHWGVDPSVLRPLVPRGFPVDTFDGQAWVGIVPFEMSNVAPRAVPALPWLSAFPELNVRTYVTLDGKPGVYFFSLDASNTVAVEAARVLAHLPYFAAAMAVDPRDGWIHYRSRRTDRRGAPAALTGRYRPTDGPRPPAGGTLEYFLTERYCLYTFDERLRLHRADIQHPPWPLREASAAIGLNTMTAPFGIDLEGEPLLHLAHRQDVLIWRRHPIAA